MFSTNPDPEVMFFYQDPFLALYTVLNKEQLFSVPNTVRSFFYAMNKRTDTYDAKTTSYQLITSR